MQTEALYSKLCALIDMFGSLQPRQKIEAGVTANVLLSLIDRMKADAPPLSRRYSQFEANTLGFHDRIASAEGTKESARRAVTHFEKQLEVFESIGSDKGIAVAKGNIAIAKSKYEGGNNYEEVLKANKNCMNCVSPKMVTRMNTRFVLENIMPLICVKSTVGMRQGNY
jgi:hypothetical protein